MEAIGPYRVERCLGAGTFAVVWLAVDPATSRRYAIKVLGDTWNRHEAIRQRFYREARLLWHADSDRIINIETVGELDSGQPYIVMEYAEGGTLKTLLAEQRLVRGALFPIGVAMDLVEQLGLCVAEVHARGAVHRDLKPENVLIQRTVGVDGAPVDALVLGDFGLAKYVSHDSALSASVGSPGYMPPEQWLGTGRIGCQADVYSLGALAYEVLANRQAFRPDVPVDAREIPALDLVRTDVAPHVHALLRAAMDPDPELRPADAAAFVRALRAPADPPSHRSRATAPVARRPRTRRAAAAAAVGLSVLGTAAITIASGMRSEAAVPVLPADVGAVAELDALSGAAGLDQAPIDTADAAVTTTSVSAEPVDSAAFAQWLSELDLVEFDTIGPPEWRGTTEDASKLRALASDRLASMGVSHEQRDTGAIVMFFADGSTATLRSASDGTWSYSVG